MVWIKTVFGGETCPPLACASGRYSPRVAAVIANLPIPAFAADLAAGTGSAPSVSLAAFTWISANAGAWFAPANPSYEASGFPSAGFDLVRMAGESRKSRLEQTRWPDALA